MKLRPADTRGILEAGWITSRRTFSNNSYWDPKYINFSDLQVINDDVLQPNSHVPRHLHQNMEIFGYVVDGPCTHHDSLGNQIDLPSGAVQRMSNGAGIYHTEGNNSNRPIRYLQLWIQPNVVNTEPVYSWHQFTREDKLNRFCDITAELPIRADTRLLAGIFTESYTYTLDPARRYYLYVVTGTGTINSDAFIEGDGYAFTGETALEIASTESEIILFDLM